MRQEVLRFTDFFERIAGLKIDDLLILFVTRVSVICVFVNLFSVFPLIHFP